MTPVEMACALFAAACAFLLFLHLSFRRKLSRLEEYAAKMASGREVSTHFETAEPFRNLSRHIESMASTLGERVQEAREEQKRLFALLESMSEGVLAVDTEQKVLLTNSALEKAFGLDKRSIEGKHFWEIFRDADINEMIEKGLRGRLPERREHSALLSESVFEIQVSPVSAAGEFLGVVAVFHDITMLKEFERLRTEFVANVSHELKTPLTSILGFVETLKEGGIEDSENRMKFLQIIETQSKALHGLIEDLLLLSRMESAQEAFKPQPVEVRELFSRMEEMFGPMFKEKNAKLQVIPPERTMRLQAEPGPLERALCNLVDNALKYSPPGGCVTLEAHDKGGSVTLEVRDAGIGIAPADLPRVFERFYRVDKSRSRESGGSGLGLSIAKHIVERHGGRIEVQSTPGKGSVFSIILPR